MMIEYVCYRDGTDLTALVEGARQAQGGPVVFRLNADVGGDEVDRRLQGQTQRVPVVLEVDPKELNDDTAGKAQELVERVYAKQKDLQAVKASDWSVTVTCPSADACQNSFSSETAPADTAGVTRIVGHPPTMEEQFLAEASKELGPDKSLARATDSAKYVISNISLIALVAGGFGIFSDARGGFDAHPALFGLIVLFAAASLAAAVVAVFPKVKQGLNYNNLLEVATAYKEAINYRSGWAKAATGSLLVALALGLVVFFLPRVDNPSASLSASWDGSGKQLILASSVKADALPDDALATVTLDGISGKGKHAKSARITTATGRPSKGGVLSLDFKTAANRRFRAYRLESVVQWDLSKKRFKHRREDSLTLGSRRAPQGQSSAQKRKNRSPNRRRRS